MRWDESPMPPNLGTLFEHQGCGKIQDDEKDVGTTAMVRVTTR
jgi:hypothetical protein